jgi:hypothetical protein
MRLLLRLDEAFVERVRRGEALDAILLRALAAIAIGASLYGAAFGVWRAPEQALYSAIKLPLVLLGVTMFTAASSAVLAPLLGARLSAMQSIVAITVSLAVTASILGSVTPIALVLVLTLPPIGGPHDASVAQSLVLAHTTVIATAGTAGVLALLGLVRRLVPSKRVAQRVVLAWMATQLLCGAQLSWLSRPFLGHADRAVTFFSADAFEGGFFEEIARLAHARFGDASPLVLGWAVLMLAFWIGVALLGGWRGSRVVVGGSGLAVTSDDRGARSIGWSRVARVEAHGEIVTVHLRPDEALDAESIEVPCKAISEAATLAKEIETARTAHAAGPYR